MVADIRIPSLMKIGGGSFAEVSTILLRLGSKRPLLVTDPFMMRSGLAERLHSQTTEAGLACSIFSDTLPDPTSILVEQGVAVFIAGGHSSLVSLGGGSPIDTAKAIGMLVKHGGKVKDYKVPNSPMLPNLIHVAVPTTAGTGSEVTRFSVITDAATEEKMLIVEDSRSSAASMNVMPNCRCPRREFLASPRSVSPR